MVTEWGMSDHLGRLRYSENEEEIFLGRSIARTQHVSDDTARLIDGEVRRLVEQGETTARGVLTDNIGPLHAVADGLLTYETLTGNQVQALLRGETIERSSPGDADQPPSGRSSMPPAGSPLPKRPRPFGGKGAPGLQPQG
jgi:cell division protease FtsH